MAAVRHLRVIGPSNEKRTVVFPMRKPTTPSPDQTVAGSAPHRTGARHRCPIDVAIQPEKSHQPIHRAFLGDIMSAPQAIVGAPVHVFRLIRKFFKHVRAPPNCTPDFPCLSEPAMACRFLLALIGKPIAVAPREQAANAVQLGNPAAGPRHLTRRNTQTKAARHRTDTESRRS
jgi:hypothetical protein